MVAQMSFFFPSFFFIKKIMEQKWYCFYYKKKQTPSQCPASDAPSMHRMYR